MKSLLAIDSLTIRIKGTPLVDSLSFAIAENQTLAIVGESGSGKSLTALSLLGLLPKGSKVEAQKMSFDSQNLLELEATQWQKVRGAQIGMVFQEPQSSLNPSIRCGKQVLEALQVHPQSQPATKELVLAAFEKVVLPNPSRIYNAYPHELSGGQKQRVMIAMALVCQPKLLICDEPTTALDVSVQKEILQLLASLQKETKMSILFISHDLNLVKHFADVVLVMQKGKGVEKGSSSTLFSTPTHPYTKGLLSARPPLDKRPKRLITLDDYSRNQTELIFESRDERAERLKKLYQKKPLLEVQNLSKSYSENGYFWQKKAATEVLKPISFSIYPGETLGLVGESGSGKSTLGRSLSYLIPPSSGTVFFEGKALQIASRASRKQLRKDIQFIFQDPYAALHPSKKIGAMLQEALQQFGLEGSDQKVCQLLEQVGLEADMQYRYPHQLSGGQRQRAVIARALAPEPKLIVCDEAVAALDISIQAQIINLLNTLKTKLDLSYLFISHDMAVVRYISDRIMVLNQGKVESLEEADHLFEHSENKYTQKLIQAII